MRIFFTMEGKGLAVVNDAAQAPAVGDLVFLKLDKADEALAGAVFKVLLVAWNTEVLNKTDVELPEFSHAEVYVLVEPAKVPPRQGAGT